MSNPWMCGASMGMVFCQAADSFAANSGSGFSLLFKSWVVRDSTSYGLACTGVLALGALRQLLVGLRAVLSAPRGFAAVRAATPLQLLAADGLLFGASLFLGYLNMLVAMAYDFGLLASLVAGETAMHVALRALTQEQKPSFHELGTGLAAGIGGDDACH